MSERVETRAPVLLSRRRWSFLFALAVVGALVFVGLDAAPFLFKGATLESEFAEQIRTTTGLVLKTDGPVRFVLLPQPHVEMSGLHFVDPSETLKIEAVSLQGDVRLLPLIVGRLEIASATLDHPKLSIDLDGKPMPADSTIGRALRSGAALPNNGDQRLGIVTFVDGTAILKSKAAQSETQIDAINVTIDWRNLDAPATLTGTVDFHQISADVAAWIGQPSSLLRGDHSAIALRLQSAPLDLSANGDVSDAPHPHFRGRLSVNAPSLFAALTLAGYDAVLPAPFENLALTSDAAIGDGSLDLPNLHLRLDGNDYEGALAYQTGMGKPSLAGTLATDQLSLAPFLDKAPPLLDANRHWANQKLKLDLHDRLDLDLRISATHLHLPFISIEDAALAVMTRDQRTEIALVEGKAYGGTLKGRASVGMTGDALSLRAAGTLGEADASALSWDVFGRQLAAGAVSASANLESVGDSTDALMKNLGGWIKGSAVDGELSEVDLGHGLREVARNRLEAIVPALRNGRTPFQTLSFTLHLADGVAALDEATLKGQDAILAVEGKADIGSRALDLKAVATTPGSEHTSSLRFGLKGPFDQPTVTPDFGAAPGGTVPAAKR